MKKQLLSGLTAVILILMTGLMFGQAPNLGTAANFVLFSTDGAVSNTGISHITGNVGTNNGSNTAFGNVNGQMHAADGVSAQAAFDLKVAYDELEATTAEFFPAAILGNGATLVPGVYSIAEAASLNLDLTLDAGGNANAVFIFKIGGPFSANASSKIKLVNGAKACNVFWKVEGLVSLASGSTMRGTIIANNAAIEMSTGDTLEGRALTTAGSITVDGVLAYTPVGCGSPVLTGPVAPDLKSTECYALFTASGALNNAGVSNVGGSVGTNVGLTVGFDDLLVSGEIHEIPDVSTATAAAELIVIYDYLNLLPYDIELLYPAQFGAGLVLTPHTYLLNAATVFTDSIYLNAQGEADAVFVIKIKGALSTSTYSKVILINEAQAKNVYWMVDGAVSINENSKFKGTIVCNNADLAAFGSGVDLEGRVLLTTGALSTSAVTVTMPTQCATTAISSFKTGKNSDAVSVYPNPFSNSLNVVINDSSKNPLYELRLYNMLGKELLNSNLTKQENRIETSKLPSGVYFYKIIGNNKTIQSGKLISQ